MEKKPLVSMIVPVYKVEPYLHRCIDSILNQTYSDFELILVDDGSPDNCGAICDAYAMRDNRVRVIHQENGGLSAARNAGIDWAFSNSDSEWITFVDSDDWIHEEYLRILLSAAQANHAEIAACNFLRTEGLVSAALPAWETVCLDSENAYVDHYGMCMTACCKLYRKSLFQNLRFSVGKLHEDCYLTHIPLFAAGKVAVCNVPLYYYFANPASLTRVKWAEKRLQELDAHEQRAAWLKSNGFMDAFRIEMEVYVKTIYEHTEALAILSKEEVQYRPYLKTLRRKLHDQLNRARSMGLLAFEREYLWMYLMAYTNVHVWRCVKHLKICIRRK